MNKLCYLMVLLCVISLVLLTQSCASGEVVEIPVQERLDAGETPIDIYNSNNSLLWSLYDKSYQGGLIFYLNTDTGSGLVAAPEDQGSEVEWGCWGHEIGGTSALIGTGKANTTLIVNDCLESGKLTAARLCYNLVSGGYDDWFLPSKDELTKMEGNIRKEGGFSHGSSYWSSTEVSDIAAWSQVFQAGTWLNVEGKGNNFNVRAVRAF